MYYDSSDLQQDIKKIEGYLTGLNKIFSPDAIYGIPKGGMNVAIPLAQLIGLDIIANLCPGELIDIDNIAVVDDIMDTGTTVKRICEKIEAINPNINIYIFVLHRKAESLRWPIFACHNLEKETWVEYFWETARNEIPAEDVGLRLIEMIGEDPAREGLVETPKRFVKAMKFLTKGYQENPEEIIKTFSSDGYDQLILLKDIEIYSLCEHHLLPFFGKAHIGYIPHKKIVGISKLARLADCFARRLQIQERLADQIASVIDENLNPIGVAVVIEACHLCMRMRGVEKQNSIMVTSAMRGVFLDGGNKGIAAREEFMNLIKR